MPWPTNWADIFGDDNPPTIEVGFGNARYLAHLASLNPGSNFLGLEISNHALDFAARRLTRAGIHNTCLIRARAAMFFWLVCTDASIQSVHINFPDPWPKAAHQGRRLVDRRFIHLLAARVVSRGTIRVATDDGDYASSINRDMHLSPYFDEMQNPLDKESTHPGVQTKYELKAISSGRECHYLYWRRNAIAIQNKIPILEEFAMPHVILSTPLPLLEIGQIFEPHTFRTGEITVRFIDFFHSVRHDQAVVDTYIAEGDLDQRVMMMIKRKGDAEFLITLRETGFPRPTAATHYANKCLAELIVSMHAKAEIVKHNLQNAKND
jgi:tRNA (guanine-N7-)-methyltransferase